MNPDYFAAREYRVRKIYESLLEVEKKPAMRSVLEKLIDHERDDFEFWQKFAHKKDYHVNQFELKLYQWVRKLLGLTFIVQLLERTESSMIEQYRAYQTQTDDAELKKQIDEIIRGEQEDEQLLMSQIEERRVSFMSSIALGVNDGLIELTGALTGFTFALSSPRLIALAGLITGVSASLSMAASAYAQARYEKDKDPRLAATFTGITYFIVVMCLVAPYLLIGNPKVALVFMLLIGVLVIAAITGYSSVVYRRPFLSQFFEMLLISLGVAGVAFAFGQIMERVFNLHL